MTTGAFSATDSKKRRHAAKRLVTRSRRCFRESEQMGKAWRDPTAFFWVDDELGDRLPELLPGARRLVVLADAGAYPHHLGERPERDAFAVRGATAVMPVEVVDDTVGVLVNLPRQPALADAGDPCHRDEASAADRGEAS